MCVKFILIKRFFIMTEDYNRKIFDCVLDQHRNCRRRHVLFKDAKGNSLSYGELIRLSFTFGDYFSCEYQALTRVGILLPNSIFFAIILNSLFCSGKIPVILNFSSGINNIEHTIQLSKLKIIVTSRQFLESTNFPWKIEQLEYLGIKILYAEDFKKTLSVFNKIRGLIFSLSPKLFYRMFTRSIKPSDPAVILFTSGSETMPKAVSLSHTNLVANKVQICMRVHFDRNSDVIFSCLPSFHSFGFTCGIILPLIGGLTAFLYPSPIHYKKIPELIRISSSTILFGTNTFLYNYAKNAGDIDLLSLKYVFGGGEHIRRETFQLWKERFNINLLEGYGITETSPILAVNTLTEFKQGSVGKFMPLIEYKIRDIENINYGGELLVKGPNIMIGYLDDNGEVVTVKDDWYNTGDIVYVDNEGYLFIIDRLKRFAKLAGEMISLTQIEDAINSTFSDSCNVVVAVSEIGKGEEIIVLTDSNLTRKDVFDCLKARNFSPISIPKHIFRVEFLPFLPSGKIDYQNAKAIAANCLNSDYTHTL